MLDDANRRPIMCQGIDSPAVGRSSAGVKKERVETAIQIIRDHSAPAIDPGLKRATIFVLKVDQFEQI